MLAACCYLHYAGIFIWILGIVELMNSKFAFKYIIAVILSKTFRVDAFELFILRIDI